MIRGGSIKIRYASEQGIKVPCSAENRDIAPDIFARKRKETPRWRPGVAARRIFRKPLRSPSQGGFGEAERM
jgi:hypothetical protein